MKRAEFLEAVRTLASDHCLPILDCLRKKGWLIASDLAADLGIHVSTATKDLNSLYECGLIERRKGQRKTRPAYEYRLKGDRIVLELDLDTSPADERDRVVTFYLEFLERLFVKAKKMGWRSIERDVVRELGNRDASFTDLMIRELSAAKDTSSESDVRSVFIHFMEKIKRAFVSNFGEVATARIFEGAARETMMTHPTAACGQHILSDLGVTSDA